MVLQVLGGFALIVTLIAAVVAAVRALNGNAVAAAATATATAPAPVAAEPPRRAPIGMLDPNRSMLAMPNGDHMVDHGYGVTMQVDGDRTFFNMFPFGDHGHPQRVYRLVGDGDDHGCGHREAPRPAEVTAPPGRREADEEVARARREAEKAVEHVVAEPKGKGGDTAAETERLKKQLEEAHAATKRAEDARKKAEESRGGGADPADLQRAQRDAEAAKKRVTVLDQAVTRLKADLKKATETKSSTEEAPPPKVEDSKTKPAVPAVVE